MLSKNMPSHTLKWSFVLLIIMWNLPISVPILELLFNNWVLLLLLRLLLLLLLLLWKVQAQRPRRRQCRSAWHRRVWGNMILNIKTNVDYKKLMQIAHHSNNYNALFIYIKVYFIRRQVAKNGMTILVTVPIANSDLGPSDFNPPLRRPVTISNEHCISIY